MQDSTFVQQQLRDLADEISSTGENTHTRLCDLADAIKGNANTDQWANSDVFKIIDIDSIAEKHVERHEKPPTAHTLEMIRNITILLPLIVTWLSIGWAGFSYKTALELNQVQNGEAFLDLWQGGFHNQMPLTLDIVALLDLILLTFVLILTYLVFKVNKNRDLLIAETRSNIVHVISDATLILSGIRSQQPFRFVTEFKDDVRQLLVEIAQERTRLNTLANKREKEFGDLTLFTADLLISAHEMKSASVTIKDMQDKVSTIFSELSGELKNSTSQTKGVLDAMRDSALIIDRLISEQNKLYETFKNVEVKLLGTTNALTIGLSRVTEVETTLGASTSALLNIQKQFISGLSDERLGQMHLISSLSDVAASLSASLSQVNACSTVLTGITTDLTKISETLPAIPNSMRSNLVDVIHNQSEMVSSIKQASDALVAAGARLAETLNILTPVVREAHIVVQGSNHNIGEPI